MCYLDAMQLFLDTANISDIAALVPTGLVDGVTTNPTLIADAALRGGPAFIPALQQICTLVPGPVSAEVVAPDLDGMLREAAVLRQVASNIVIKLPLTEAGLIACQRLNAENVKTNVTLCFTAAQALAAMKSGATYISPFLGRFEAKGGDAEALLADIITFKHKYGFATKVLAASIRTLDHLNMAARMGADCATFGPALFRQMIRHDMTDDGLAAFTEAWAKTGQSIA